MIQFLPVCFLTNHKADEMMKCLLVWFLTNHKADDMMQLLLECQNTREQFCNQSQS